MYDRALNRSFATLVTAFILLFTTIFFAPNAQATPEWATDPEASETVVIAWKMESFPGYATWPQTYVSLHECGDAWLQVDTYKYGTDEVRAYVDSLGDTLLQGEDGRVYLEHVFIQQTACGTPPPEIIITDPIVLPPAGDPVPEQSDTPVTEVTVVTPATPVTPAPAAPAQPVAAQPTFTG